MFGLKAPGTAGSAVRAPRRQPPAAAAGLVLPRRKRCGVAARDAAAPAPLPACGLDDEALDQALRAQLSTRWLPYDGHTARKALTLAAGVAVAARRGGGGGGGSSASPAAAAGAPPPPPPQPPSRESVARNALPVYQALLADRLLDTWRFKPLPVAPAGADGGAPPPQQQQHAAANAYMSCVLWHERWRLANTVRILSQERAECERTLAKGGISKWRADSLASQAEYLSADILAIERLLRISEAWGDALPTAARPAVAVAREQQQQE